jgi:choline dehydrogenase
MNYNRATVGAMQKWADAVGDESYLWENVLPFYEKGTNFTPPNKAKHFKNETVPFDRSAWSPAGGPLHVSYSNYLYAFSTYTIQAFTQLGVRAILGFNSGKLLGQAWQTLTLDPTDETRSSSETSYLTLALQSTDLITYTHTLAKRVILDDKNTAIGVVLESSGVNYTLNATKEVILSAGAFQSPQLLMVSGIGPADVLQDYDIPVVANRPGVGQNMWDSILYGISYEVNLETTAIFSNPTAAASIVERYLDKQEGPLTTVGNDYAMFGKVSDNPEFKVSASTKHRLAAEFPADWPEAEWLSTTFFASGGAPPDNKNYATISPGLLASFSRGNVTITSSNMNDPPIINPNWLTDPADQEIAVAAFKYARKVFQTNAMKRITIGPETFPGQGVRTDAEILEFLRSNLLSLYHAAATCAMGKTENDMAVVDSKARVIGVNALRVVDISAFPFLPPGQPQATVYMLAEKIAEDILSGK